MNTPFLSRKELRERHFRQVSLEAWRLEEEEDREGNRKVIPLSGFPGVFKDSQGELHDLRPKDICPCFSNLFQKVINPNPRAN